MSPVPQPDEERDKGPHQESDDNGVGDAPNFVVNQDLSESDEDNDEIDYTGYQGYQMLPQDGIVGHEEDSDSSNEGTQNQETVSDGQYNTMTLHQGLGPNTGAELPSYMQVPDLPAQDPKEHLWNTSQSLDIQMDDGRADVIKAAMVGFELPSKNIPDWAKDVTEDQWKDKLLMSLKSKKS